MRSGRATLVALAAGLGVLASASTSTAGADSDDDVADGGLVVLPGVTYSPESGVGLGVGAMRYFRLLDGARPSRVLVQGQIASSGDMEIKAAPEIWFAGDRWGLKATALLERKEHAFFGVGNGSLLAMREDYQAVRFAGRLEGVRRLPHGLALGLHLDVRGEQISETVPDAMLDRDAVPGAAGGRLSGLGLALSWDGRDNAYAPRRGWLLVADATAFHRALGSEHDFGRLTLDASVFCNPWREHVIALDARLEVTSGDAPFDELAMAGGKRHMRGMLKGRFRDRHFATTQMEYRFPLWWRLGGVAFAGVGRVADRIDDLAPVPDDLKVSAGGGLRYVYDRAERIHVRADVAFTGDQRGLYLTLLEAF